MKNLLTLVGILFLLVLATACNKQEETATPAEQAPAAEATAPAMEEAVQATVDEATAVVEETPKDAMEAGQEMDETAESAGSDGGRCRQSHGRSNASQRIIFWLSPTKEGLQIFYAGLLLLPPNLFPRL